MKRTLFALTLVAAALFAACSKNDANDTNGNAKIRMHLTDGPGDYDAIYLDIQSVELTTSGGGPVTLTPVRPGVYELLQFRNGLDTLLMEANIPAGTIQQMRLKLGSNNSIVVDGQAFPLSTPSGQQSGIKLNLNQTFAAGGAYDIWIDFDAAKSIVQTGNGQYKLKPVIRAYSAQTDGRIRGYVFPFASLTTVYAISTADTFSAIPDPVTGYFRISGLQSGSYNVWFDADAPGYQDQFLSNVMVSYGMETDLDTTIILP